MLNIADTDLQNPIREKYTPCAVCDLDPGTVLPHFHDAIEIIFTTSGSGIAICNGVKHHHKPGSVFFAASNEVHYFTNRTDDINGLVVDIEPHILVGSVAQLKVDAPVSRIWENPEMDHKLWDLVAFIQKNQFSLNQETLTSLTSALLMLLLECVALEKAKTTNSTVTQIVNYCQEHCAEPISLELLSQELSLSISHISRIFSQKLKISFSDYINGLRLNAAVNLMNTTNITITKAAAYAGFPTIRTFNRVFIEQYGITPSQYRQTQRKNNEVFK